MNVHSHVWFLIERSSSIHTYVSVSIYVTRFAKPQYNDAFLEIQIFASVSSIYIPKALFCSNINAVLQILFELHG